MKDELYLVEDDKYIAIDNLTHSIPYLTPRAAWLLKKISVNFNDSLRRRGIPERKIIVTSVLRTEEDVARLRRVNRNATENSAHRYATTFDISALRFCGLSSDTIPRQEAEDSPRLRQVLEFVLRDLRAEGRCYVKRERKQHCYHITARG